MHDLLTGIVPVPIEETAMTEYLNRRQCNDPVILGGDGEKTGSEEAGTAGVTRAGSKESSTTRLTQEGASSTTRLARKGSSECRGWYSWGYLPHFDRGGVIQHITYHLGDSLPLSALLKMQQNLDLLPEEKQTVEKRKRLQILLDNGYGSCILGLDDCAKIVEDSFLFGDGVRYRLLSWVVMPNHVHVMFKQKEGWPLGKVIQSCKRHTSREIHLLYPPSSVFSSSSPGLLSCLLLSPPPNIQNSTPHTSSSLGPRSCTPLISPPNLQNNPPPIPSPSPLWQLEYWDRFIRDEKHFFTAKQYIENNPVKAGLVAKAEDWRWSSAWKGRKGGVGLDFGEDG